MAQISLDKVREILKQHVDWKESEEESPEDLLYISLGGGENASTSVLDSNLASKTITYEGRAVTVVLDFDEGGYLKGIEFL